jgi:hypothetical protein
LLNLPPILGGVSGRTRSHTPVSATILGSALLGSTLLGTTSQGHPSSSSPLHGSGGPTSSQGGSTNPPSPHQGSGSQHTMAGANPPPPLQMPYLASLNIPDLTKLTNDPILHDATWPAMPTKLPSDIPKFEGKAGDDPANHVMTFHLWCSSNSIMEDSVRLRLFQRTLTGPSAKWYVEEKSGSHTTFESLAKAFLTFFQLPIRHDNGLELLSNFKQSSATHIADHIHEWRRRRSLCKAETTKQQCLDWFLRSLVALLGKDVASTFPQSEEEAISKAQQYDLIYAQSGYLYTVLPDLPKPVPFGQDKPGMSHSADGLIGTTMHHSPQPQPPPMYGTPQYPPAYGGTSYYPPPPYQQPYPVATPPPISGPPPAPPIHPPIPTTVVLPPHHLIVLVKAHSLPMYLMDPHHHKIHTSPFPDLHNPWLPHIHMRG